MEYWISVDENREGPFTREQLLLKRLPADTLVWHDGMTQWEYAVKLPELVGMFTPYEIEKAGIAPVPPPLCPPTYLVWSILSMLCCCQILGIVAIIYGVKTKTLFDRGKCEEAEKYSERTALWLILSFVIGLVMMPIQMMISLL